MTRADLLTQIAYATNKNASSLDATTQARLLGFINKRQRQLLTLPGIKHLREATITVASVADQASYALVNIAKINRMFETTNDRVLYEMSKQDYRLIQPDTTITGTPEAYVWLGQQAVSAQPADASSVFVKSTSAADTTQTCYVEGVITGNYPRTASVTLTGATAVDLSASITTWIRVDKFYLSAVGAGTITLHEDSGSGTELARITIGKTTTDYTGFALFPTPSSVVTYNVDITRAVTDLAQSTDVSILPEDFHDLLVTGGIADELKHLKDERWSVYEEEYGGPKHMRGKGGRVGDLLYFLAETAIGQPRGLVRDYERPSQLGSWFPAGS